MGIFTVLTTFEISGGVLYRGISKFENESESFLSSALGAASLLSVGALFIYMIFKSSINGITELGTPLTLLLFLQIFLNTAIGIYFAQKRYEGDYKRVAIINLAIGIISPALALLFIFLGGKGESRIIAPLITHLAIGVPVIFSIVKRGRRLFSRSAWRFIFSITVPLIPHYLSLSLIAQSDKIILSKILGEASLGRYSAAYSVGFMMSLVTNGILLVLSPWIMKRQKASDTEQISAVLSTCAGLVCLGALFFLSVAPELFRLIVRADYYDAITAVYPITLSVVFLFLSSALQSCLIHYEKPAIITKNSVFCASVCLALNFLLIEKLGYAGGAMSTLLSYALLFVLNSNSLKRLSKNSINVNISFNFWILMAGMTLLIFFLRHSLPARMILLAAIGLGIAPRLKKATRVLFICSP